MLYTVGPVNVAPDTLQSMNRPMITHRSPEYKELHGSIVEKVRKALDTDMEVFLVAGSASVFLEGAIRNGASEKTFGITNGSFGNRSIEIAELNGKTVDKVEVPWGKAMKPEHIDGKIGKAIMLCSERMLDKAKAVKNRGFYTDLLKIKKQSDVNYALTTPPVSLMYGLDYQLDKALSEGMEARYRRHQVMADLVRDWADKRMEGVFPEKGYQSNSIGVINRGSLDFDAFHKKLKAKGFEISNGYGEVKESTFRIGHMGDVTVDGVKELLATMDSILEE